MQSSKVLYPVRRYLELSNVRQPLELVQVFEALNEYEYQHRLGLRVREHPVGELGDDAIVAAGAFQGKEQVIFPDVRHRRDLEEKVPKYRQVRSTGMQGIRSSLDDPRRTSW